MKKERKWNALTVLNVLINADRYLTTGQIADRAECERKSVYNAVNMLETNGFGIEIVVGKSNGCRQNRYRFKGIYGL